MQSKGRLEAVPATAAGNAAGMEQPALFSARTLAKRRKITGSSASGRVNGQLNGQINGQVDWGVHGQTNGQLNGQVKITPRTRPGAGVLDRAAVCATSGEGSLNLDSFSVPHAVPSRSIGASGALEGAEASDPRQADGAQVGSAKVKTGGRDRVRVSASAAAAASSAAAAAASWEKVGGKGERGLSLAGKKKTARVGLGSGAASPKNLTAKVWMQPGQGHAQVPRPRSSRVVEAGIGGKPNAKRLREKLHRGRFRLEGAEEGSGLRDVDGGDRAAANDGDDNVDSENGNTEADDADVSIVRIRDGRLPGGPSGKGDVGNDGGRGSDSGRGHHGGLHRELHTFSGKQKSPESEEEEEEERRRKSISSTPEKDGATSVAVEAVQKNGKTEPPSSSSKCFAELGLVAWLVDTCREMGIRRPSPVQAACIPAALRGENVMGVSQTGSGKTAAFALPILQKLAEDPFGVFALVLTPTRELGLQIADQFRAFGASLHLRDAVVIGGADATAQALKLATRPHVVVATPGRLHEHLKNDASLPAVFSRAKFLVLDEADRLLDVGFAEEMGNILSALPKERQTMLFSATMTNNLEAVREFKLGKNAFFYEAYEGLRTVDTLDQSYVFIPANVKDVYLCHVLATIATETARSVIVFASTCRSCQLVATLLDELGVAAVALHSLLPQRKRTAALQKFKAGAVPVLIATDVASRGLDIPTVDLVINYDVPRFTRDYVHRVGRTARAGRGGRAISLVTQYDVELVQGIERLIGRQLAECEGVKEDDVIKGITKVFKARRAALLRLHESGFDDLERARKESSRKLKRSRSIT